MSWTNGPFLGFDTETTGVDPSSDRIVTAALVYRDRKGSRTRTWLLDPGVEIPQAASDIHGITTAKARAEGREPAAALNEIVRAIVEAQLEGVPLVIFNANFDLTILESELARHDLETLADRMEGRRLTVLDPLVIDRGTDRYRKGSRKLGDLVSVYGIGTREGLHTADVDVEATLDILTALTRRHPTLAKHDLDYLYGWQAAQHRRWATGYNEWRAKQGMEGPGAELTWPMRTASRVS